MKTLDPVERLRAFIDDADHPERSRTWLAGLLGISQAAVSQWLVAENRKRPDAEHRALLERITGIPAASWLTDEEREDARALERRVRGALKATGTDGR